MKPSPKIVAKIWMAGAFLSATVVCPAAADEYWACDYEVASGIKAHPTFQVTATEIIPLGKEQKWRLLQNTPAVIIGANSAHWVSPSDNHEKSAGDLMFIDKKTG